MKRINVVNGKLVAPNHGQMALIARESILHCCAVMPRSEIYLWNISNTDEIYITLEILYDFRSQSE
jgi:hypothetical protein